MADERKETGKVQEAGAKDAPSAEYKRCKKYFRQRVKERKAEIEQLSAALEESLEKDKTAYREIGKKSAVFYGNNLFGFFMLNALLLLPFAVASVLIRLSGASVPVSLIPIIVALAFVAVRVVMRLVKLVRERREIAQLKVACADSEKELKELYGRYIASKKRRKKLRKIYMRLKQDPSISEKRLAKLRSDFEKIDSEEEEEAEE